MKVIIVGAGVAGLYAAWRMCLDKTGQSVTGLQPSDVLVLESGSRIGGRLFTKPLSEFLPRDSDVPKTPAARAELGGMRFLNFHTWVGSLAKELGLNYVDFPADSPANWHYLRGSVMQSFSNKPAVTTFSSERVYHLTPAEHEAMQATPGSSPGSLIEIALSKIVNPNDQLSDPGKGGSLRKMVDQLLTSKFPGTGVALWKRGLWNALVPSGDPQRDPVSNEAYEYWSDAGAYDSVPSNWNAATASAMVLSDFSNTSTYYALAAGYESLPDALYEQLRARGLPVRLKTKVIGFTEDLKGFTVTTPELMHADNLILALPPRALQLLKIGVVPGVAPIKPEQIMQATPEPMVKVFLVYKNTGPTPWWGAFLPGGAGDLPMYTRLTTDLPLRQVYNFGTFPDAAKKNTYSLVQVAYTDELRAGYWAGLLSAEKGGPSSSGDVSFNGYAEWTDGSALSGHPLFSTAHAQFVNLLTQIRKGSTKGATSLPTSVEPLAGAAMDWGADPFGGGYNTWNVGVDVASAYPSLLNSRAMNPTTGTGGLFVVGEGYSVLQGWVEGALWSVEDALRQAYGIAWQSPPWYRSSPVPPAK
jgi:monoamine oxidase